MQYPFVVYHRIGVTIKAPLVQSRGQGFRCSEALGIGLRVLGRFGCRV